MSEQYRLAFSGEVLEGQHRAVVRKRLAAILNLDDKRMDVLFSGKRVVVKNATDEKTAARYQAAFNKAGARLRVFPLADSASDETHDRPPAADVSTATVQTEGSMSLLPAGADVLTAAERKQVPDADIDTSHLRVQDETVPAPTARDEGRPGAPSVEHITMAEPGANLGVTVETVFVEALSEPERSTRGRAGNDAADRKAMTSSAIEVDADFDLAEVGAILKELDPAPTPAVDVNTIDFDVAEPGSDLGVAKDEPPPVAPDTSHISLEDQQK